MQKHNFLIRKSIRSLIIFLNRKLHERAKLQFLNNPSLHKVFHIFISYSLLSNLFCVLSVRREIKEGNAFTILFQDLTITTNNIAVIEEK